MPIRPDNEAAPNLLPMLQPDANYVKSSKVSVSKYPSNTYPTFAQGNAYALSVDMADTIAELAEQPYRKLIADDILIGLIMDQRQARKVLIVSDFVFDSAPFVCSEDAIFHFDVTSEMISQFFENDISNKPQCYSIQ